mgnify:CR=1 FL=1
MLQKELAKRLKARYDTKMDGNEWMKVSSDGIPLCRIKYNGQFLSNADQNLSDEYRSKIADIQDEMSTVREYVGLRTRATNASCRCLRLQTACRLWRYGVGGNLQRKGRLYVLYLETERRRRLGVLG